MALFANVNNQNIVENVIVIPDEVCGDSFPESDALGAEFCRTVLQLDGRWLQTFEDGRYRGEFAGIGFGWSEDQQMFLRRPSDDHEWTGSAWQLTLEARVRILEKILFERTS